MHCRCLVAFTDRRADATYSAYTAVSLVERLRLQEHRDFFEQCVETVHIVDVRLHLLMAHTSIAFSCIHLLNT